jgi:hypothetical protein
MTTAEDLLRELWRRGVSARVVGEKLRLRPSSKVPLELIPILREHKPALLRILSRTPPGWPADVEIPAWWRELVDMFPPKFLLEARRTDCRGCGFPVAVLWNSSDRGPTWSCPQCGLASTTSGGRTVPLEGAG